MTKLTLLMAAKWREFLSLNPFRDQIEKSSTLSAAPRKPKEGNRFDAIYFFFYFLHFITLQHIT